MNRHRLLFLAGIALLVTGCETVSKIGTSIGVATGTINQQQADSINKTAAAADVARQKFTPEQEYYLGRSVSANVLMQYRPFDKAAATDYLNLLGQTLALASDKPSTFSGYHFLILDSDEVNAIAAPSGFILVTRGLLRCCKNEDELAAVLAHEIAHVQLEHGVRAITSARWKSAGMTAALEAGKNLGGQQLAAALNTFEDCIRDVAGTILNNGYARTQEYAADKAAVAILYRVGYNPTGLAEMLRHLDSRTRLEDKRGFGKTHPPPQARIKELTSVSLVAPAPAPSAIAARAARFQAAMAGL